MERCVYCGAQTGDEKLTAKAHTRSFPVCSDACRDKTESYVQRDKKRKLVMYLAVLAAGILVLVAALSGKSMLPAYIGQLIAGAAFVLIPYPVSRFETFLNCPIKTVTLVCRIVGLILIAGAVVFLALT